MKFSGATVTIIDYSSGEANQSRFTFFSTIMTIQRRVREAAVAALARFAALKISIEKRGQSSCGGRPGVLVIRNLANRSRLYLCCCNAVGPHSVVDNFLMPTMRPTPQNARAPHNSRLGKR